MCPILPYRFLPIQFPDIENPSGEAARHLSRRLDSWTVGGDRPSSIETGPSSRSDTVI
jgi:hypothetical protein